MPDNMEFSHYEDDQPVFIEKPGIKKAREALDQKNAKRKAIVAAVKLTAKNVSENHINDVLDALWLLGKLDT